MCFSIFWQPLQHSAAIGCTENCPASRSDCTLSLRWELRGSLAAMCRRGMGCSGSWKNTIFPVITLSLNNHFEYNFRCNRYFVLASYITKISEKKSFGFVFKVRTTICTVHKILHLSGFPFKWFCFHECSKYLWAPSITLSSTLPSS